jgi:hypothetical protein
MKARDVERKCNEGQDVSKYPDLSKIKKVEQEQKRVNVDFPVWMIHSLDKDASRLGVPRQSVINLWVAERLEKTAASLP